MKERCGDWTDANPDKEARADAAYNIREVLEYIDSMKSADGRHRGAAAGDGNIEGITADGDARHGTEAGMLKDFAEQGYSVFDGSHRLHATSDTHVRWDGSNKDNFQWFCGEVGKALFFIPGLSNVLQAVGESRGGAGEVFLAVFDGIAKTLGGGITGLVNSIQNGEISPFQLLWGAYRGAFETAAPPGIGLPDDLHDILGW